MNNSSFGFGVEKTKEMNLKETHNSIIADIEQYWGHECLTTSTSFISTLL